MAHFKVTIGDETHEVEASNIQATGEGYGVLTPDSVPDGFYTENALQQKIKERVKNTADNARQEALEDESFHRKVLNKYNIALDSDGKPQGLEPTVDVDAAKKAAAESVKEEYEEKMEGLQKELNQFKQKGLRSSIVDSAAKLGIDGQYLEPLVEGGSPYLVKELQDNFAYNEDIGDYAKLDTDGTFEVDGEGVVTVDKFFEKNKERFKPMLKDNRQRGANYQGPGKGGKGTPSGDPRKWSRDTKLSFIKENGQEGYKEALNSYKAKDKQDS